MGQKKVTKALPFCLLLPLTLLPLPCIHPLLFYVYGCPIHLRQWTGAFNINVIHRRGKRQGWHLAGGHEGLGLLTQSAHIADACLWLAGCSLRPQLTDMPAEHLWNTVTQEHFFSWLCPLADWTLATLRKKWVQSNLEVVIIVMWWGVGLVVLMRWSKRLCVPRNPSSFILQAAFLIFVVNTLLIVFE